MVIQHRYRCPQPHVIKAFYIGIDCLHIARSGMRSWSSIVPAFWFFENGGCDGLNQCCLQPVLRFALRWWSGDVIGNVRSNNERRAILLFDELAVSRVLHQSCTCRTALVRRATGVRQYSLFTRLRWLVCQRHRRAQHNSIRMK